MIRIRIIIIRIMSYFRPDNFISFKLNDSEYTLHKHVIQKMDLFNSLMDNDIIIDHINIIWDISLENADIVFHCINDLSYAKSYKNINAESCYEIISFMKYVGVDSVHIRQIIINLLSHIYIIKYIDDYLEKQYHDEFIMDILTNHVYWSKNFLDLKNVDKSSEILKIVKKLKSTSLSRDIKLKIIVNMISVLGRYLLSSYVYRPSYLDVIRQKDIDNFYGAFGLTVDVNITVRQDDAGILYVQHFYNYGKSVYNCPNNKGTGLVEIMIDHAANLLLLTEIL